MSVVPVEKPFDEDLGHRHVARSLLEDGLREAEERTLAELEVVRHLLGQAIAAVSAADVTLAEEVSAQSDDLTRRYDDIHERLLTLMARQAPVAGDLRLATALLHVNDRVTRMGAQCVNIATLLLAMPSGERPGTDQLECLCGLAELAAGQVAEAARTFAERDLETTARLHDDDMEINTRNRRCFAFAVRDGNGNGNEAEREVGFLVALMARAIERIGDNAVDVGRQAIFAGTGRLRPAARA